MSFWCCVVAGLLTAYVAAYGVLRWQDVLIHDVKYFEGRDGYWYSRLAIRENSYVDDTGPLQKMLGRPAAIVFMPLCELEEFVRTRLRIHSE